MIYKNIEIYGVEELYECENGGVSWLRYPKSVTEKLEHGTQSQNMVRCSTGVELRFVINSGDSATITMAKLNPADTGTSVFHVYRGGIQGSWEDHEVDKYVGTEPHDFVIKTSPKIELLKKTAEETKQNWSPAVVRIIFDRGAYRIIDVVGDVRPPKSDEIPPKTAIFYGSSITHGSNSLDASHSWVARVSEKLGYDARNLGLAGACAMEPAVIDFISSLGKENKWDLCVMELGINVLSWDDDKIIERATNAIATVAEDNPDKPIYVISPFYCEEDFVGGKRAANWRDKLSAITEALCLDNVTYIDGLTLLCDVSGLSADMVHPNINGVDHIANGLLSIIKG